MTTRSDDGTSKKKTEPAAEAKAAEELACRAREQGLSLTGPALAGPYARGSAPGARRAGLPSEESVSTRNR